MSKPVVAVTGSEGFIGSNLVRFLRDTGFTVWTLDREGEANYRGDLRDLDAWPPLDGVSALVHCAGSTDTDDDSRFNNSATTRNAIGACYNHGVPLLVNLSSSEAAENELTNLSEACCIKALTLRLFNVIGARQRQDTLPWEICQSFHTGKPVTIDTVRGQSWTNVIDVVRAVAFALLVDERLPVGHTVMDYGTDVLLSQADLFAKFETHLNGWKVPYSYVPGTNGSPAVSLPDMAAARAFFSAALIPTVDGVDRAVKDVLASYCTVHNLSWV